MTASKLQKIMYVEDDLEIQKIARLSLERVGGFTVRICGSGEEAVEVITQFSPDMVLLDVMMPGMDGMATMKEIRTLPGFLEIPIIFLTAMAQVHEVEHYKKQGAVEVITKPFDPMGLPAEITAIWERLRAKG